jgi:hypothetical protein
MPPQSELTDSVALMRIHELRSAQQKSIFREVVSERLKQIAKWGEDHQTHPHMQSEGNFTSEAFWRRHQIEAKQVCDKLNQDTISWEDILYEEITEAFSEPYWPERRRELIQCAAVIFAEIEDGDNKAALTEVSSREMEAPCE